jgi:hypothetical protein
MVKTDGMEYIGLSPSNDKGLPSKIRWLDNCMPHVTDSDGFPIIKFHGFAATSIRMILRFPWFSVDSASWVILGGYGKVWVPRWSLGKWDFLKTPYVIVISDREDTIRGEPAQHFYSMTRMERAVIEKYFNDQGFTLEQVQTDHAVRGEVNALFLLGAQEQLPKWPNQRYAARTRGLNL